MVKKSYYRDNQQPSFVKEKGKNGMNKRELRQLICASLIGDGHIAERDGVFIFEHSADKQADYAEWKANLIDNIFINKKLSKRCCRREVTQKVKGKIFKTYRVELYWKEYIGKFLHPKCYIIHNNSTVKNIEYILTQIENDLHLALWFMDDGGEMNIGKLKNGSLRKPWYGLFTYSFTLGQVNLAKQWFKSKYNLNANITYFKPTNSYYLRFCREDAEQIFKRCEPYFSQLKSMRKKFKYSFETFLLNEKGPETRGDTPEIQEDSIVQVD